MTFTPLIRHTFMVSPRPVTGNQVLAAVETVVARNNLDQRVRPRLGWDDGDELVYIQVHSPHPDRQLLVRPFLEDIDFFTKTTQDYVRVAVEFRDWNDEQGEESYGIAGSDEGIHEVIKQFAADLKEELST